MMHFPKLTKSEKRLCALISIDMSTKNIAILLNISPETVKKTRHNLRKKIGLGADDSITNFLNKLLLNR